LPTFGNSFPFFFLSVSVSLSPCFMFPIFLRSSPGLLVLFPMDMLENAQLCLAPFAYLLCICLASVLFPPDTPLPLLPDNCPHHPPLSPSPLHPPAPHPTATTPHSPPPPPPPPPPPARVCPTPCKTLGGGCFHDDPCGSSPKCSLKIWCFLPAFCFCTPQKFLVSCPFRRPWG